MTGRRLARVLVDAVQRHQDANTCVKENNKDDLADSVQSSLKSDWLNVARVVEPASKLATARQLSDATAAHSLGALLGLGEVDTDELYAALDRLHAAQPEIEQALANVISRMAFWCSTMSAQAISKASTANLRNAATAAITAPIVYRLSMDCSATSRDAPWPSRFLRETPRTR
jgi:hypothetical protein